MVDRDKDSTNLSGVADRLLGTEQSDLAELRGKESTLVVGDVTENQCEAADALTKEELILALHDTLPRTLGGGRIRIDYELSSAHISTEFWSAFARSKAFEETLMSLEVSRAAPNRTEVSVVVHADGSRFNLIVLDPFFKKENPIALRKI